MKFHNNLNEIIEMAWCDKTSFNDIYKITNIAEPGVIRIMRQNLKPGSFRVWRKLFLGRKGNHRERTIKDNY